MFQTDADVIAWSLREAKRISQEVMANWPVRIYLFGSWARGDATKTSDIDIGIFPEGDVPASAFSKLRTKFEESNIPYHVDVVNLNQVEEAFRQNVMKDGIPWN